MNYSTTNSMLKLSLNMEVKFLEAYYIIRNFEASIKQMIKLDFPNCRKQNSFKTWVHFNFSLTFLEEQKAFVHQKGRIAFSVISAIGV